MRLFEVARTEGGERIPEPQHMLDDENAYLTANAINVA